MGGTLTKWKYADEAHRDISSKEREDVNKSVS